MEHFTCICGVDMMHIPKGHKCPECGSRDIVPGTKCVGCGEYFHIDTMIYVESEAGYACPYCYDEKYFETPEEEENDGKGF